MRGWQSGFSMHSSHIDSFYRSRTRMLRMNRNYISYLQCPLISPSDLASGSHVCIDTFIQVPVGWVHALIKYSTVGCRETLKIFVHAFGASKKDDVVRAHGFAPSLLATALKPVSLRASLATLYLRTYPNESWEEFLEAAFLPMLSFFHHLFRFSILNSIITVVVMMKSN